MLPCTGNTSATLGRRAGIESKLSDQKGVDGDTGVGYLDCGGPLATRCSTLGRRGFEQEACGIVSGGSILAAGRSLLLHAGVSSQMDERG